jgi:hypothetical protein
MFGCQPIPCTDGWTCIEGYVCDPQQSVLDVHGCAPISCADEGGLACADYLECTKDGIGSGCEVITCVDSSDCNCGTCVLGICRPRPGVCQSNEEPA